MSLEASLKELDVDRLWRARELSDLRNWFSVSVTQRDQELVSRSVLVLAYAHWEGFCYTCVNVFIDFLVSKGKTYEELPRDFFVGATTSIVDSFRDKADNLKNRLELSSRMRTAVNDDLASFDRKVVLPRSNLNFERLKFIFTILDADISPFQTHRIKLDRELVAWRHQVAHGQMFVLNRDDVIAHSQFCEELMFLLKATFEKHLIAWSH